MTGLPLADAGTRIFFLHWLETFAIHVTPARAAGVY